MAEAKTHRGLKVFTPSYRTLQNHSEQVGEGGGKVIYFRHFDFPRNVGWHFRPSKFGRRASVEKHLNSFVTLNYFDKYIYLKPIKLTIQMVEITYSNVSFILL